MEGCSFGSSCATSAVDWLVLGKTGVSPGPGTTRRASKLLRRHQLDQAYLAPSGCFVECLFRSACRRLNVDPPTLLFLPVMQLIGQLPANPTDANCPLRKFGQGPPFPPPQTCRTYDHEEMLNWVPPVQRRMDLTKCLQNKTQIPRAHGWLFIVDVGSACVIVRAVL